MIEKIGINLNTQKIQNKNNKQNKSTANPLITNELGMKSTNLSTGLLQSYYVSFGAKKKNSSSKHMNIGISGNTLIKETNKMAELESNLSYHGEKLLEDSRNVAKKYGHITISQEHVLRAGLSNILDYMAQLDSGETSYDDESSFGTHMVLEDELVKDVIKNKEKRNKIKPIIEKEIEVLDKRLSQIPVPSNAGKVSKIEFSKDLLNDIYSIYTQDNDEDMGGDGLVHDTTIFDAAFYPNNDKVKKEVTVPFRMTLKDEIQIDKKPMSERVHLSFYDEKAKNIWKNLSVGTNMVMLYDKEAYPTYLINSFLNVFEESKNGFGNLTKDKTKVINFNDNGEIDNNYIKKKIKEFGKDKDNKYVLLMSIMDKDMDSLSIDGINVGTFASTPSNVKFVFVADKDVYYKESNGGDVKHLFSDFGEVTSPLMNMAQAQQMFKEQPKLLAKNKKQFSPQAVEKCVEAANQLQGNYPAKVQKVMDLVSAYHVDKEKITLADVTSYINEAKDIFKPVENDNAIKMVFDTGIKLKDMVGAPTTKKEAKSIVERIKDKTMGTKGFIIYSQDGSVGAGRKYTAQAIAGESKSPYVEINAVDFGTKDVDLFGGGNLSPEASMKKLFGMVKAQAEANSNKSAILFIENFEYFSYGEFVSEYHEKAMSQLIREMNKAQEQGLNIVVMGSMGDPNYIGDATTKSFKFIDKIEIESPGRDTKARAEIIDYYIKKKNIKIAGDKNEQAMIKEHINLLTEHASYIEILTLLDKAKNVARERKHKAIDKADFTEALLQIECGRPSSAEEPEYRKDLVTSHECGHATNLIVMEELTKRLGKPWHQGDYMNFITLDARSWFGGAVFHSSGKNTEYSLEKVFADLVCDFGGNSCEHKFFGQDGSWGITCDMEMATNTATLAAGIMGQGKYFGKKSLNGMSFLSEEDKNNLNKDIDVMLKNAQVVSDAITEIYADFNREFTKKYSSRVGTGECIIHRKEFVEMFNDWKSRQSAEKQKEFEELDKAILEVIAATKRGTVCYKK